MSHDGESCLVGGPLYTVLRLSRFHGVAPLDLKPLGNFHVARFSKPLLLYSWLIFTGLSVAGFISIIMDLQFYGTSKANVAMNISSFIIFLSHTTMVKTIIFFGVYDGRTRINNLIRYLKQIEKVNRDMRCDLTQQFSGKILSAGVICILVTSYVSQFMYFGMFTHSSIEETIIVCLFASYCIDDCRALLLLMQIACFVLQLQSAFKQINNRLRELMDIQSRMQPSTRRAIRNISTSYVRLCCVVRDFNKENGFVIFVIFAATTSAIFISCHHLLLILCLPDLRGDISRLYTIFVVLITIVIYFAQILMLIEPCHRTHEEMEETNVLLNKVTCHLTPLGCPVPVELEVFHMQVTLLKTNFSLLRVYILQRSLTATVISSLIAFIVFIKQYNIIVECK